VPPEQVKRLISCSGHVWFDLVKDREEQHKKTGKPSAVAIARVEQLSPFPFFQVAAEAKRFPKAEVVWVQEEHMNSGAWTYVSPRFETALKGKRVRYIGRPPCASTAAGKAKQHSKELHAFINEAFKV